MKGFITFDQLITPVIIKYIFAISVGGSILLGIVLMNNGIVGGFGSEVDVLIGSIFVLVIPIIIRIYLEFIMVAFKILESLEEIQSKLDNSERPL